MNRRSFHHEPEEVRRATLIRATLDAVAERGLPGATVREVAQRALVTPGLIRRYFVSKDRMVEAAYATFVEDLTGGITEAVGSGPPVDRLERLVRASCTDPLASPRHVAIWTAFVATVTTDPAMAQIHRDGYRAVRVLLEDSIADLRRADGCPDDPDMIHRQAIAANAVIDGIWLEVSLDRGTFADIDVVDLARDSILAIITRPSADRDPT